MEIAFRAWHKEKKKMFNIDYMDFKDHIRSVGLIDPEYNEGIRSDDRRDVEIMQYTGFKDKDGIKIFQGDIIKIDEEIGNNLFGEVKQLSGGQYYIDHQKVNLKYQHQIHCEVCETESPIFFLQYFDSYELKIIGNIYEIKN
jgi:uncharacterized phage protein (TIGR01671 family)